MNDHGCHDDSYVGMHNQATRTNIDPFTQPGGLSSTFLNAIFATALFRCWHLILFFTGWAAMVVLVTDKVYHLAFASTLLTVFGTVLGFVISYRTTASFERYNEGRRYWSTIVYGSRLLSRTIWFHVPDTAAADVSHDKGAEARARIIIEKKSAVNLIEAFAVSLKHYLRGEEGIFYEDLYHLVKYLPVYALPAGRPSLTLPGSPLQGTNIERILSRQSGRASRPQTKGGQQENTIHLPTLKATSPTPPESQKGKGSGSNSMSVSVDLEKGDQGAEHGPAPPQTANSKTARFDPELQPSWNPPAYALFDVFPFSLFVKLLQTRGRHVKGKKGAKLRARGKIVNHNVPLELTLYLSSYISALQQRKVCDVPTINTLLAGLNQLVDSLTGLERILTTPIPFSYSIHLWTVTTLYVMLLPFQLFETLKYLTIPATALAAFIFYGFIVAGEEIENPFGYDKNDLNLDHFTHNIIRAELAALTSRPMPNISSWAFEAENSEVFSGHGLGEGGIAPSQWVKRGEKAMRDVLANADR